MPSTGLYGRGTESRCPAHHVDIGSKLFLVFRIDLCTLLCLSMPRFVCCTRILTVYRLKCNRSHPCENCVRRGDASSCSYAAPGTRKKNQSQGATTPDDMQNRIDRLEGLVLSLMTNGAQSAGPTAAVAAISRSQSDSTPSTGIPLDDFEHDDEEMIKEEDDEGDASDVDRVANSLGMLKVDAAKGKSLYFGDSHWHMVLADVSTFSQFSQCVKSYWLSLSDGSITYHS